MGRQKHDIRRQKASRSAARRGESSRKVDTEALAQDLVRRGLAPASILRPSRHEFAATGRANRKDGS